MSEPDDKYLYIELAAALPDGGFRRNEFVRADDFETIRQWRRRYHDQDVYASICRFRNRDRKSPYVCPFFADFDADDPRDTAGEVIKACELLHQRLGVAPDCVELHFSGAKGFHLIVPRTTFGSPALPEVLRIWRALASRLAREGVKCLDLGIYDRARVLRLANSINTKTGLYKIPVEYKELRDLGMDYILEQAEKPRDEDALAMADECPRAVHWFSRALESVRRASKQRPDRPTRQWKFQKGWRMPPCIVALERAKLPDGLRHEAYFALSRYYAWVGMHPAEAERRLCEIDARHPIRDSGYIRRVVDSGRKCAGFPGCQNAALRYYCRHGKCFLQHMRQRRAEYHQHSSG